MIKAIAYSYWRSIQRGNRTYESVPTGIQPDVKELARQDVEKGAITAEQYRAYIGEDYPSPEM